MSPDDTVYRVLFLADGVHVEVIAIGMDSLDLPHQGIYDKDDLPEWMQSKLSSLAVLHTPPPVTHVDGLGQRMSKDVFWVYPE